MPRPSTARVATRWLRRTARGETVRDLHQALMGYSTHMQAHIRDGGRELPVTVRVDEFDFPVLSPVAGSTNVGELARQLDKHPGHTALYIQSASGTRPVKGWSHEDGGIVIY